MTGTGLQLIRGTSQDIYESRVDLYGKEDVIDNFIQEIELNRIDGFYGNHVFQLSSFASEHENIFGENVSHAVTINATAIKIGKKKQNTWKGFKVSVVLRNLSPVIIGTATLPDLNYLDVGFDANEPELTVKKYDSYTGVYEYIDKQSDLGIFTGTFTFTVADMQNMRRYIRDQRSTAFSLTGINGVGNPFGVRLAGSYPYNVKIIKWQDLGFYGLCYRKMKITFARTI